MDIKRLDHLGIVAGVIKDLGLIEAIDQRLQKDELQQEKLTPGEAIAGMILNGLGFSDKPLSLTPQFFESKALELLFRPGVEASDFNRHKLGKMLDRTYEYGCESLFFELAELTPFFRTPLLSRYFIKLGVRKNGVSSSDQIKYEIR